MCGSVHTANIESDSTCPKERTSPEYLLDMRWCKFVVKLVHELASSSSIELEQLPIMVQAPVLLATVSLCEISVEFSELGLYTGNIAECT